MTTIRSTIDEGEVIGSAALIKHVDGTVLINTDVTSWTAKMFDLGDAAPLTRRRPIYAVAVTVATTNTNSALSAAPVIWNTTTTPRNDSYWTGPDPGYNFLYFITKAALDAYVPAPTIKGGHKYLIEYVFSTVELGEITLRHEVTVTPRNT